MADPWNTELNVGSDPLQSLKRLLSETQTQRMMNEDQRGILDALLKPNLGAGKFAVPQMNTLGPGGSPQRLPMPPQFPNPRLAGGPSEGTSEVPKNIAGPMPHGGMGDEFWANLSPPMAFANAALAKHNPFRDAPDVSGNETNIHRMSNNVIDRTNKGSPMQQALRKLYLQYLINNGEGIR